LLPRVLAHVADPQIAGLAIERVAPRIPQTVRPDLRPRAGPADEGVVARDPVGPPIARPGVDPEHLPEQRAQVLAPPVGIALASAVAQAEIEIAVGSERQVAPIVVRKGLVHDQDVTA